MSSWSSCVCTCPAPFFPSPSHTVSGPFFTALSDAGTWHFPVFRSASDYTGTTSPILVDMQTYYTSDTLGQASKYTNVPVLATRYCRSSANSCSDVLEQRKQDNILEYVQNGLARCPMDSSCLMLYNKAKDKVFDNSICSSC